MQSCVEYYLVSTILLSTTSISPSLAPIPTITSFTTLFLKIPPDACAKHTHVHCVFLQLVFHGLTERLISVSISVFVYN